jgi:hypothetical protein
MKNMKIFFRIAMLLVAAVAITGCYGDFVGDAPTTTVCFAQQKPYRTVISGRDMEIFVGVSIGGKREVDMSDWATFEIDASLLSGTGLELLPPSYYTLTSPDRFTVRKSNLPVADVGITFTQAFYDDPKSVGKYYALPLRIKESSLDEIVSGKESTVMAVKYISNYHGTYFIKGTCVEVSAIGGNAVGEAVEYSNPDLTANPTRDLSTRSASQVVRPGVANIVMGSGESASVLLTVTPSNSGGEYDVTVSDGGGSLPITGVSGKYHVKDKNPEFVVSYYFERGGKFYKVDETLILRQDPNLDMRVETW